MISNLFNYISGALSIVSFVITLTPFFPQYKEHVRFATVFFLGTLIGSLFASAQGQTLVLQFEGSIVQALLLAGAITCAVICIGVVLAIALGGISSESHSSAGGAAFGLFIVFMIMYS